MTEGSAAPQASKGGGSSTIHDRIERWRERLLEISKRNPLVSMRIGDRGAVEIVSPTPHEVWTRLFGGGTLSFPWKRDLLGLETTTTDDESDELDEAEEIDLPSLPGNVGRSLGSGRRRKQREESDSRELDLEACKQSSKIESGHLLTELTDKLLGRRLTRLNLTARTSLSETGVNVLFLTFGVLRWYESPESNVPLLSPLLLVPVRLARTNIDSPWLVRYDDEDISTNFTIGQKVGSEFGFTWPGLPEDFDPSGTSYAEYFDQVRASVSSARRWVIEERVGLGAFSFQKIAMWRDLGTNAGSIAGHDTCRAIAGESRSSSPSGMVDVREADQRVKPSDLHNIRDCDSTQLDAILAAKAGLSFVLDGPPGTGKSQTIANIVSEFIASGRTVLFVSEKAAALEVVKRRLDQTGLGDFCLECHSHKANKKVVLNELGRCLKLEPVQYRDQREDLDRLFDVRARLTGYVRALHRVRGALELTPYQVHGRLAELRTQGVTRCAMGDTLAVDRIGLRVRREAIAALGQHRKVFDVHERHPWRGTLLSTVSLTDEDDIRHRFTATASALGGLRGVLEALSRLGFGSSDPTFAEVDGTVASAREVATAPDVRASWFTANTAEICQVVAALRSDTDVVSELRKNLSSYRPDVHQAWGETLRRGLRVLGNPSLARFKRVPAVTVRGEISRFKDTLSRLEALAAELTGLKATVAALREMLRQSTGAATIESAEQLATMGELVAGLPDVQFAWVDNLTRSRMRTLIDKCVPVSQKLERCREALESASCTGGFDEHGAEIAQRGEGYSSFWSRLSPGWWWGLRGQARSLYAGVTPTTVKLLADLRELRSFHECRRSIAEQTEPFARQLPSTLASTEEWIQFGATLEKLDQLRGWSAEGDALLAALGRQAGVNRSSVRRLVEALVAQIASTRRATAAVGQMWAVEPVGTAATSFELTPVDDLLQMVESAHVGISEARAFFVNWSRLLLDRRDVPINQVKRDGQLLDKLVAAHDRVTRNFTSQSTHLPAVNDPTRHDWSGEAEAARWTLERLERHAGCIPPHVIRVVSDPNIRRSLRESLSAFDRTIPGSAAGYRHVTDVFPEGTEVSNGVIIRATALSSLEEWLMARAGDVQRLREWTEFRRAFAAVDGLGLGELTAEILGRHLTIEDAENAFLKRFYRAWLDAVYAQDPALRDFRFEEHEKLIEQFRDLDRAAISGSGKRIREKLLMSPDRPNAAFGGPGTSELGILRSEVNKKRRHKALRQLFREIPTVLTKLKPCIMMSPLAVSTFFDSPQLRFDLVIFDEASQVRPQEAIGAIYRGKQLIVAGDQKQLPPTSFFEAATRDDGDSEEHEDDISDFESILDIGVSTGMARKSLRWHYRSRRESLIAFSNHHIYDGDLVTFPSARDTPGSSAVTLVHVAAGKWVRSGRNARNPVEARRVAELVFEHFRTRPNQSIGVVAFSQSQQLAILAEIERLRRVQPELEEFFDEERPDPFFVKNLENVQGDERNVIVVSVGYGYDTAGKFSMNFGPMNKQGGERRLNVLATRATDGVRLVSSIRAHDIDLGRSKSRGVELLKYYLDYAERGVETLGAEVKEQAEGDFDSPFEAEVWRALRDLGHDVRRQIGCSGYRVDLAIVHPQRAGEFVLGIECDGATYHSSITARDRDRLRQEILEGLGWRIVRVWSTDWVVSPRRQLDKITRAYELALRGESAETASGRVRRVVEDEEPIRVATLDTSAPVAMVKYDRIDDVPKAVMSDAILSALKRYGATPEESIVPFVAQSLGFQRTGKKIRHAIELAVGGLVTTGAVIRTEGRLMLPFA